MRDEESIQRDWITIWQSELAAAAADPELAELWLVGVAWWNAWQAVVPARHEPAPGAAGSDAAAGSAPAAAAPEPGDPTSRVDGRPDALAHLE